MRDAEGRGFYQTEDWLDGDLRTYYGRREVEGKLRDVPLVAILRRDCAHKEAELLKQNTIGELAARVEDLRPRRFGWIAYFFNPEWQGRRDGAYQALEARTDEVDRAYDDLRRRGALKTGDGYPLDLPRETTLREFLASRQEVFLVEGKSIRLSYCTHDWVQTEIDGNEGTVYADNERVREIAIKLAKGEG